MTSLKTNNSHFGTKKATTGKHPSAVSGRKFSSSLSQLTTKWLFLVPLKGGIGGIVHPPNGMKNTTYSPCQLGGYMLPIPHFRGTISTTIENMESPKV